MQPCVGRVIVGSEGLEIHENWGLDGPKIMKNHGLEGLGGPLGAFWRSLAKLWLGFLRKLSPGEAQDRLRERQVGERAAHVGAKMATWCSTWRFWGRFGIDLGSTLAHWSNSENSETQ